MKRYNKIKAKFELEENTNYQLNRDLDSKNINMKKQVGKIKWFYFLHPYLFTSSSVNKLPCGYISTICKNKDTHFAMLKNVYISACFKEFFLLFKF